MKWFVEIDGGAKGSPALDASENVYVGGADSLLYKVSSSGTAVWTCALGDSVGESSPVLSTTSDLVIIGANNGILYAASTTASSCSSFTWTYTTGGAIRSSPLIDDYGTVFVGSRDGYVHAVRENDGTLLWKTASNGNDDFDASPVIDRHESTISCCRII